MAKLKKRHKHKGFRFSVEWGVAVFGSFFGDTPLFHKERRVSWILLSFDSNLRTPWIFQSKKKVCLLFPDSHNA